MSKRVFTKISPAVWQSEKFISLDSDAKILLMYYMTCEHQNSSGCYRIPDGYGCTDLAWENSRYINPRSQLVEKELITFDTQTSEVFVHKWFKHNPAMNEKHAKGTRTIINLIESQMLKDIVDAEFQIVEEQRIERSKEVEPSAINNSHLAERIMRRANGRH